LDTSDHPLRDISAFSHKFTTLLLSNITRSLQPTSQRHPLGRFAAIDSGLKSEQLNQSKCCMFRKKQEQSRLKQHDTINSEFSLEHKSLTMNVVHC